MAKLFSKLSTKNKINTNKNKNFDKELIPTIIYEDVISKDMYILYKLFYYDEQLVKGIRDIYGKLKIAYEFGGKYLKTGYIPIEYACGYKKISKYLTQAEGSDFHRYMIIYGKK